MAATTTQTVRLIDCPVCGEPIEAAITYDVRFHADAAIRDLRSAEKVSTATIKPTGVYIEGHKCPITPRED